MAKKGEFMKSIRETAQRLWKDESGQGMAEYVLLIVVVVTVAYVFKDKIKTMVSTKLDNVSTSFNGFTVDGKGK